MAQPGLNIVSQPLQTKGQIGFVVTDVEGQVDDVVMTTLRNHPITVRCDRLNGDFLATSATTQSLLDGLRALGSNILAFNLSRFTHPTAAWIRRAAGHPGFPAGARRSSCRRRP
ncbi:hypothetical protein G6F58_012980 [Rhizopus delemar]|nr:hypothetical protein G6F58_012980 [Rhizopus delemar]